MITVCHSLNGGDISMTPSPLTNNIETVLLELCKKRLQYYPVNSGSDLPYISPQRSLHLTQQ